MLSIKSKQQTTMALEKVSDKVYDIKKSVETPFKSGT